MVYESDFYTTRRYRTSPSLSTYTVSQYGPSKQVRILPGIGKVHVVHTYDRIVPYVGHKRLTVVSPPPQIFRVRPSVLLKEFDRISYKYRPAVSYSYVNNYLNSDSAVRISYNRDPLTDPNYIHTPANVHYHHVIGRPSRLYYDILGYPRWSRYWYRYWYDVPTSRYSDYYYNDASYTRYWPLAKYRGYWSPSWRTALSPSTYSSYSWYPSLNLKSVSPYWSKYWASYDSPYWWSTYWQPTYSRYWRSAWNSAWTRWYDVTFNDETSRIRADAAGLLKRIHSPVVRSSLSLLPYSTRYSEPILSSRITSDDYIYKMLNTSPYNSKLQYTTYYSGPVRKYIGPGRLAAVSYAGGKAYGRRPNVWTYEDPVKDDIQLLSYYINKFRGERALKSADENVEETKQEISAA